MEVSQFKSINCFVDTVYFKGHTVQSEHVGGSVFVVLSCCYTAKMPRTVHSIFHNDGTVYCSGNDAAERVDMLRVSGEKSER